MRYLALPLLLVGALPSIASAQALQDQVLAHGVTEEVVLFDYPTLPLDAMTTAAGAVVHVAVRSSDTFLSPDGASILTDYRVAVIEVAKDASGSGIKPGDVITVRRVGGTMTVAGRRVFSNESGFPPFSNDAEYVLFLNTRSGQPYQMVAGAASAYRVDRGAITPIAESNQRSAAALLTPIFLHEIRASLQR